MRSRLDFLLHRRRAAAAALESGRQPEGRGDRAAAGKNFIPSVGLNEERKCAAAEPEGTGRRCTLLEEAVAAALARLLPHARGGGGTGLRDIRELGEKVPLPPPEEERTLPPPPRSPVWLEKACVK